MFCKPLEHVGIDPLVLLVVFPHLPLAEGDLGVGGAVGGVHLENVPEVPQGEAELVPMPMGLASPIEGLLVVSVHVNHLRRGRSESFIIHVLRLRET